MCAGTHPAPEDTSGKHQQQQRLFRGGAAQYKTCAFTNNAAVVKQRHCAGAKMASSEFVRLFRDTPGAMIGGERAATSRGRSVRKDSARAMKANDYELIFAKQKDRGEKTISFERFLAPYCVFSGLSWGFIQVAQHLMRLSQPSLGVS